MYAINLTIAIGATAMVFGLMVFSAFVGWIDLSPAPYILTPIWGEVAVYSAFMIRKAEKENLHKYPPGTAEPNNIETETMVDVKGEGY